MWIQNRNRTLDSDSATYESESDSNLHDSDSKSDSTTYDSESGIKSGFGFRFVLCFRLRIRNRPRSAEFMPEHNLLHIQWNDIQTETRSSHGISSVAHNSKLLCGRIRGDCSSYSPQPHASVWFRYVDNTFTVIHEYHVDEFTTHPNSLD